MKNLLIVLLLGFITIASLSAQTTYRGRPTSSRTETYTVPDTNMLSVAKDVWKLVNEYRASKGLPALKMQKALNKIAFDHSYKMATGQVPFSHINFHDRVKLIDQYANIPYRTAENLYAHKISINKFPYEAIKGWINSPGHKKNMDGQFIHTGLGVCRSASGELFVTQLFVGKASFLLDGAKGVENLEPQDETTGLISPKPVEDK